MSPAQLKKLQELSQIFSNGKATPREIQQLSALLAQINCQNQEQVELTDQVSFIVPNNLANIHP